MSDNSGNVITPAQYYSPPMRGKLSILGLQGVTAANLATGGLPSQPGASEPPGDALEVDVPMILPTDNSSGRINYGGIGSRLPDPSTLDYVHKAASASLLSLALILLIVYAALRPRRALQLLEGRAGGGGV